MYWKCEHISRWSFFHQSRYQNEILKDIHCLWRLEKKYRRESMWSTKISHCQNKIIWIPARFNLIDIAIQVDRSGHRISQDLVGNMREIIRSCRKTRDIQGTWKQYYRREFFWFLQWFLNGNGSCWKEREVVENSRLIPDCNITSKFLIFSVVFWPFPIVRRSPW